MKHYGDITKISGYDVEPVWIVTGGSPCQDLSVAGKRAGLDGERSGLFMEQIRIIKEMRENDRRNGRAAELVRPRWMVWENVYGAFSSNKGEDFRVVLEETAKVADEGTVIPRLADKQKWTPSGCIMGDGWSIAWRVHDAQFWGVPQRRRRIALVADFGGASAPEILFEREGVSRNSEQSRETWQETAGHPEASVGTAGVTIIDQGAGKSSCNVNADGQSPTLSCTHGGEPAVCYGICSDKSNSMLSKNPNSGIYQADTSRTIDVNGGQPSCNQGGMAVVQQMCYGFDPGATRDVGKLFIEEQSKALTNGTCPGHHNGVVCCGIDAYNTAPTGNVTMSITGAATDAHHIPCIALDRASFNQGKNAQYNFQVDEELAQTLVSKGPGGGNDTVGALCARDYKGVGNQYVNEGKVIIQADSD